MDQSNLQELFLDQVKDLYDAEKQLVKALPKMAKMASSDELEQALRDHLEETQNQVTRLESVFETLDAPAKGKPCKGMRGLIEEGNEEAQEYEDEILCDLAIIASAQRVEHYEISGYGTARTLAEQLGNNKAAKLLEETEEEEKAADEKLNEIAMMLYEHAGQDEEMETEDEEEEVATAGRKPARAVASGGNRRSKSGSR